MPFNFPSPHDFALGTNLWTPGLMYSNWVKGTDGLEVYLGTSPAHPPYVQGSTTIVDHLQPTWINSNLFPDHPMLARLGSPFPKPSNPGVGNVPLSTFDGGKYDGPFKGISNVTIKKEVDGQIGQYKIGANTYMGNIPNTALSDLGYGLTSKGINKATNLTKEDAENRAKAILALGALSGFTGAPRLVQLGSSAAPAAFGETSFYNTTPFENLNRGEGALAYAPYQDFRSRRGVTGEGISIRLDGASALARSAILFGGRGAVVSAAYAASSALIGAYSVFNLEATYGWGEHGTKYALRTDFTSRSHVSTRWSKTKDQWVPPGIGDPIAKITPFRGDKVSVIDFKHTTYDSIYNWNPKKSDYGFKKKKKSGLVETVGAALDKISGRTTKDFIKFFFTGPKITPFENDKANKDDVMVFRAIITNLTDSYNPQWSPLQFIGRADPNYNYTSYDRQINLDFTVYATDKDELKPIWRKLNALASYTAPEYDSSTIGLKGPWMRFTIGDLFIQQPIIITSLYYTMVDPETTWEINIEEDPGNMEVPMKVNVSLGATVITDYLPQKGGRMYTLAKTFGDALPKEGTDNWLSDTKSNEEVEEMKKERGEMIKKAKKKIINLKTTVQGIKVSLPGNK